VEFNQDRLMGGLQVSWFNPRIGECSRAERNGSSQRAVYFSPGPGDWLLVLGKE
jgi:hypothetical protein